MMHILGAGPTAVMILAPIGTPGVVLISVPEASYLATVTVAPGVPMTVIRLALYISIQAYITVTFIVAIQVLPVAYVIVAVPPDTPVTTPETGSTVAMAVLELYQKPPGTVLDNGDTDPWHIRVLPVIGAGIACTFIVRVA